MKVTFLVMISVKGKGSPILVEKNVNLTFLPFVGLQIESTAWEGTKKVKSVTLELPPDSEEPRLCVWLDSDECENGDEKEKLADIYQSHGWRREV